ncbi:beta-ketoacyl synthase chain length factor [Cupriavidus basilensis]|uniref:beta-ketoacyl synthase chain length factor n=1 Tax=Cupriavidus basilensis TaxID=68895 RepID=UPI0023E8AEE9|nr:beta-ketoacyl synthase chain length factor [Cupriavidus basilensis]MDF3888458.1 beta-ketoacyl synthase chain length factor [Cupriavidus basilensis]
MEFGIRTWAACAAQLDTQQAWQAWSLAPWLPVGDELPTLAAMAPMLRRRITALGRAALHPAYACQPNVDGIPAVFASRHGDTQRPLQMLGDIANGEPLSPTAFGLSVHNATGALYSIDRGDPGNQQALAAGRDTVEAAVVEACGLLADGEPEVLLVYYEAPLAAPYAIFADEPECLFGWAWRVGKPQAGQPVFSLASSGQVIGGAASATLPHGLEVLRFMLAGEPALNHAGERANWEWRRHG